MTRLVLLVLFFLSLLIPSIAHGQTLTTVTGVIADPQGFIYTGARITVTLQGTTGVVQTTPCPGNNQAPGCSVQLPSPFFTDALTGKFTINLWANAGITCTPNACAGTTYTFTVDSYNATANPPIGTGPQHFAVSGITVAGSSQDISATLSASAPKLTNINPVAGGCPNGAAGCANQLLSNLTAPTAVNQDLLPQTNGGENLGSSTDVWFDGYFDGVFFWNNGTGAIGGSLGVDSNGLNFAFTGNTGRGGYLTTFQQFGGGLPGCANGELFIPNHVFSNPTGILQYCGTDSAYHYAGMVAPAANTFSNTAVASAAITTGQFVVVSGYDSTDLLPEFAPAPAGTTSGVVGVAVTGGGGGFELAAVGHVSALIDNICGPGTFIVSSATNAGYGHCTTTPGTSQILGYEPGTVGGIGTPVTIWATMGSSGGSSGGGGSGAGGVTLLYANATPVTVSNTTAESTLMQYTIPANTVTTVGQALHIVAGGNNNNSSGSNANYVYKLYFDSTVIATHSGTDAVTGDKNTFWNITADAVFTAVGAGGSTTADGTVIVEQNNNGFTFPATQGATNVTVPFDTTTAHTIKVTVTLGTAATTVAPSQDRMVVDLDSGGPVSVNEAAVPNPDFNATTPAAPGGNTNCTFQVSGSRVSCYVPSAGTSAFSALTPGTNSNAGTFAGSGNTWDFSAATLKGSAVIDAGGFAQVVPGGHFAFDYTYDSAVAGVGFLLVSDPACGTQNCVKLSTTSTTSGVIGVSATTVVSPPQTGAVVSIGPSAVEVDGSCSIGQAIIPSTTVAGNGHCTSSPGSTQVVAIAMATQVGAGTVNSHVIGGQGVAGSSGGLPSGVAGQSVINNGAGATSYSAQSPTYGLANGGALISLASANYPILCDSATVGTGIQDRGKDAKVGTGGANSVIVPDFSGAGCSGMYGSITNSTGGSVTVSRQTTDTFNVFGPSQGAPSTGATTFTLSAGQWATYKPSESATAYDIHIYAPAGGTGTVSDGSGTSTPNQVLLSTATPHSYNLAGTLPLGTIPTIPLTQLATQAADSVVMNATAGAAAPTAVAMPTCTTGADLYNTSTHTWSCVSSGGSGGTTVFTTAHTLTSADNGKLIQMNCSAACAVTLPNPQPSSSFVVGVQSIGTSLASFTLGSTMTWRGGATAPALGFGNTQGPGSRNILWIYADSATATNYVGGTSFVSALGNIFDDGSGDLIIGNGSSISSDSFDTLTITANNSFLTLRGTGGGTNNVRIAGPIANAVDAIAFSTTPAISMASGNVHQFSCTTAGSAIAPTFTGTTTFKGEVMWMIFVQNGTTACTWTWPSTIHGGGTVSATLGSVNVQEFIISNNGTDAYAVGPIQTSTGGTP